MDTTATSRSMLLRRVVPAAAGGAGPWLIALHADGADADDLVPLCRAAVPALPVCALQAPRSRNPFLGTGHAAPAAWGTYRGYSWFRRDEQGCPEPASLGDALWQVEQVAVELADAGAPVLLGRGEGATLALAAATHFPERLSAVVAVGADGPSPATAVPVLRLAAETDAATLAAAVARWLEQQEVSRGRG